MSGRAFTITCIIVTSSHRQRTPQPRRRSRQGGGVATLAACMGSRSITTTRASTSPLRATARRCFSPQPIQAIHFVYLSFVTLTGHGMFKPASSFGRFYAIVKAFVLLILWSCYAAALTAIMVDPPQAQQDITTVRAFPPPPGPSSSRPCTANAHPQQGSLPPLERRTQPSSAVSRIASQPAAAALALHC